MELKIAYLYPQILNHYGDKGNILTLKRRLEERSIKAEIIEYSPDDTINLSDTDIIYLGGGTEKSFQTTLNALETQKDELKQYAENGGVILAVCTGYEILGNSLEFDGKIYDGIGIFNIDTRTGKKRIIGNIIIDSPLIGCDIVGFENHTGIVSSKDNTPLGKIKYRNGTLNETEGSVYKNALGTYIHGPLLPKNPVLADYIISCALKKKYGEAELPLLDDTLENKAHDYIINRFIK